MRIMQPTPSTDNASSDSTAGNPGAAALRRAWQWMTLINTDDPVRLALNHGFAYVIITLTLILMLLNLTTLLSNAPTITKIVILAAIPFHLLMWWLNRRGTIYGAIVAVIWFVFGTALGFTPSTYAGELPIVHVAFMLSIVVATLFIRPRAGIWALALQMAALGIALAFSDVPREHAVQFLIIGTLNLGGVTAFLIVGTTIFSRALRSSIAANAELQQLNAELDQRVAARTAALAVSEARQRLVLGQLPALIWTTDSDLRFTSSAGAGLAGLNSRPNQVVGMSLYEYFQTDDPEFGPIAAARRALTGEAVSYDIVWSGRAFQSLVEPFLDPLGRISGVIGIALDITERKAAEHEREQLIGQLQEALASIKTLRGLVPICAACKKIRDDSGYWNQLESYLHTHTEAEFSHGICPECTQQLYGDLYDQAAGA
jgi:PAS domain-containing protein